MVAHDREDPALRTGTGACTSAYKVRPGANTRSSDPFACGDAVVACGNATGGAAPGTANESAQSRRCSEGGVDAAVCGATSAMVSAVDLNESSPHDELGEERPE